MIYMNSMPKRDDSIQILDLIASIFCINYTHRSLVRTQMYILDS